MGELAGRAFAGTGTLIRDVHVAIARRAFEAVGPGGASARTIHDGVAAAVYGGVRVALEAVARGTAAALATTAGEEAPSLAASPRGARALAVLNAYAGDALAADGSELALDMTLRHRGADLDVGTVTGERLAIFIHGLGETDAAWRLRATPERPGYGVLLQRELGYTPLQLRYNTGRHISDNGRELAALLERVHDAWPVAIDEVVLVGHSMGGLVARSACHYGHAEGHQWTEAVRHVICLGSPHLGVPLEKGINALGWALANVPETRPLARAVNARSAGIKDLRFGACVEEDWCDSDEYWRDRCTEVPFLPNATYYFVGATFHFIAATISRGEGDLLGTVVGDLLVRVPSASGAGRRRRIRFGDGRQLGGLTHFDLLNHPAVYEQIRAWLAR